MMKCKVCDGNKVVAAGGGWASEYDTRKCPHCKGTGEEPEEKKEKTKKPDKRKPE